MPTSNDNARDVLDVGGEPDHGDDIDFDHSDYVNEFREYRIDGAALGESFPEQANPSRIVPPPVHRVPESAVAETSIVTADVVAKSEPSEPSELPTVGESEKVDGNAEPTEKGTARRSHHPDPALQSLVLLATMAVMLAAARYAVPQVVEEIRYAWHRGELRAEYDTGNEGLKNVSLDSLSEAYQMVTAAVGPSVVHIEVSRHASANQTPLANLIRSDAYMVADQGSGVVIDEAGYLVTNRHVIAGGERINVTLGDGRRTTATVVGTDPLTDLAVLKVNIGNLLPITWGDSDRCRVGSPVWAVGSPFGLDRTVTFGILSGKHRMVRASTQYQDFMQSDVAVNPGNSGGPLVDVRGKLVGINTAIVGDTYQGVSFSIPSNVVRQVYERIIETGRVERGWLGVGLGEVADSDLIGDNARVRGAIVNAMTDLTSPAAVAGLRVGDLIVSVDQQPISDVGHLMRLIGGCVADTIVDIELYRDGEKMVLAVQLGSRPEF
ncbi:putative serine protease HtrA [Novipirellula aureliae]|uniref:Putative serine protease HtrA n=1 Tax=Novipirellula aureliae TaxID=2527966 RepID=A0A5C6E8A7_9BACT|nr:trypsin-like peptidase domain-containing protein [Novipirellula aureliae]TWU45903.1 putative serine protease HtrA [Novipirellula aureliae]